METRIAIVGAGFMGAVIASIYGRHGYHVVLHDKDSSLLESFGQRALPIAETLSDAEHPIDAILGNVTPNAELEEAVDGAFLVHEIVQEDLETKQKLFALLDQVCEPQTVLATNTSSFLLTEICREVERKERVLGIHFITPAHVIRAVELIYADHTPQSLVSWGREFLKTIDHVGVACRERPGFIVNRIQYALLSEVYRILDEGVASQDDVDAAVRLSLGPRLALWGPLLTEDLVVSKKTVLAVTEYLHHETGDPSFAPRQVLRSLVESGRVGAISGKGWYEFNKEYASIVRIRDKQLKELLSWLQLQDPVSNVGVKT
jgi:3-hydroxybutyryl-CoA dehydrogenase